MSVAQAQAKGGSAKRTLLLAALGVLALDIVAVIVTNGAGLEGFPRILAGFGLEMALGMNR